MPHTGGLDGIRWWWFVRGANARFQKENPREHFDPDTFNVDAWYVWERGYQFADNLQRLAGHA